MAQTEINTAVAADDTSAIERCTRREKYQVTTNAVRADGTSTIPTDMAVAYRYACSA